MSKVKNETTNNSTISQEISRSAFDHAGVAIEVSSAVKDVIVALNSSSSDIVTQELKARHVTYEYVAKLCDAAIRIGTDDEFALGVQTIKDRLLGSTDKESATGQALREPNPFLNLTRIADGEWASEFNSRTGARKVFWKPNRSGEKYAGVCRFAVRNGLSGADMLRHFTTGEDFYIPVPNVEKYKTVKATINAVIAEDRLQNQSEERDVLNENDWKAINNLPAVVTLPLTKRLLASLTLSEGGVVIIAGRVEDGNLYLYGDAGIEPGNPVHRQFKKFKAEMFSKAYHAVREPETPETMPEEFIRVPKADNEQEEEAA